MNRQFIQFTAILKKELSHFFHSPSWAIPFLFFLLGSSIPFYLTVPASGNASFRNFSSLIPFVSIIVIPSLTMNIWAGERQDGTDFILLSLPVSGTILVLGKFLSLLIVYACMLILTLPVLATPGLLAEGGIVISAYLVLFLFGSAALAIGEFMSFLFHGAVPAFISTAAILLALDTVQIIPRYIGLDSRTASAISQFSFSWHFDSASRGVLDSRDILFYLIPCIALLFANVLCLKAQRSRS
jgi:ABC-2 type transport system permease protein